ncbi:MAG: glutamyl-tRNA reductase [Anaerolineales bacterium]|uniref:Glutamyl-tRNA reductase n=1 Tax=Candidatus Desulfolinea nitratireducens TaxID=2841698 RepID=A0A8J6NNW9_9CHLR|nr:glutamyl-tRNA reductase [Candidatus Desulfolinea nitratireducens]MBL6959666.1 glutamyl-tRNA reductase [Anaerolineales bacterium]
MTSMPILMIGLNHKVAPVEVRERLAFGAERIPFVLKELLSDETIEINEVVLLSTCNRTEIYLCTCNSPVSEKKIQEFFASHAKLPVENLQHLVYVLRGEDAVEHLMQVSAGLDSLVLGENEILGQVRSAAETAQVAGATGPILSALFRYAIQAGKRARAETEIGRGDISVASVVVELAQQALGPLENRTVLLIGAGKISSITARALIKAGLRCIMIANRTYERAEKLAQNLHGTAVHFDALNETLKQADIVICSTGAPHIVLHADAVEKAQKARDGRPLLVADLAVPRDADPEITSIPGVQLANIDDLGIVVKTSHPVTRSIYQKVEVIIQQEFDSFHQWYGARGCVPIIQALHSKAEIIYQAEVEKTLRRLGSLTPHQEQLVQAMGKAIVGKLLHEPTVHLRELSADEDPSTYLKLVQDLYGIQ